MREALALKPSAEAPRVLVASRPSPDLKAVMATQDLSNLGETNRTSAVDRSLGGVRGGSIGMVLLVAVVLVGAAVGLLLVGRGNAGPYILILLSFLAMAGVFSLFAIATGILRVAEGDNDASPMLRAVVDEAADGLLVTDLRGRVIYANPAYLDLVDAANERDVRPIERVFIGDPDVSEAVYRLLKAAREGRKAQEEARVTGLKGRPASWLRLRVRPLGDARGGGKLTLWTVTDVTRDRERQETIFQELQHAIDYLDHAPAGFFSVDGNGEIGYLNATLASWLDHDLAQVGSGGLKLADIVSGNGAALLTTLAAVPGEVKTEVMDIDFKTRGGRTLPVRLFHKVAFGADGMPGASRTLVLNRAKGESPDAQSTAEVRFMRFFQSTPMAIATVDKAGKIWRTNALFARLFPDALGHEKRPEKASTRSILATVSDRDREPLEAAIRQAAAGQSEVAAVDAALTGSGERYGRFYVSPVEEGDAEAAIVYVLETTGQRMLENQVNQRARMESVGQLAGGIAHDFNNVLSAIMMATDFLLNAHKPTDPSFGDIMQIKQNANRAASLVRQLLAFSRKQTMRPQTLDLGERLEDLRIMLSRLIGEKVVLDVKHDRDLWPVKADVSQFEQVIVNLAVNARDAMPNGGRLNIRTANIGAAESARLQYKGMPAAEYVLVEVTDTGTGIPAEIIDKIFDPFFSTKEVGKGTGLGLSTVYGIVKQTGGFIYPVSTPGKGTTFRIFLPRHDVDLAEEDTDATLSSQESPTIAGGTSETKPEPVASPGADLTGHGTILLVEDEDGLRALNARGLTSRGYSVLEAGNGVEAMAVLEKNGGQVDLVVSDVVMPEMDGPTLLKELRKRNPTLKIIFVSGYAEEAFAKSLPQGEQFSFLPKPFTLKQLVGAVKETMSA